MLQLRDMATNGHRKAATVIHLRDVKSGNVLRSANIVGKRLLVKFGIVKMRVLR